MLAGGGTYARAWRRAFTLVELMIVVAIIGVLAALAIYGVRLYLASAKTGEAKDKVGAIARGAVAAYEREATATQALVEGSQSAAASHTLCDSASPVPSGFVPAGKKYQPDTSAGADYQAGDGTGGWQCLKFNIAQPHYYRYGYTRNGMLAANASAAPCVTDCYEAAAQGDLDGDGTVYSYFARTGQVNTTTKQLKATTQVYVENQRE